MFSAYTARQYSNISPTAEGFLINGFIVEFVRSVDGQYQENTSYESRLITFADGTAWTICLTVHNRNKVSFSIKYLGEPSVLASASLKITSGSKGKVVSDLNQRQDIDITTIHKYDPVQNNLISGPYILVSDGFHYQCLIITVEVVIHVGPIFMTKNHHSHNLQDDFTKLLHSKSDIADVVLNVGGSDKIPVHKVVLCARSAVFLTMFENHMQESQTNEIVITDASAEIVKEFVAYLYSDTCQITADTVVPLLQMAHKYAVRGLVELCESELLKGLAVQNVVDLLVLSDTYDLKALKRAGIELFAQNYAQVSTEKSAELKAGVLNWTLLLEIIGYSISYSQ